MNILITVCARGGSKGIPGKNIKQLNGKPLIYYTLKTANEFRESVSFKVDIVLSTDSNAIKDIVKGLDFEIDTNYTRPEELSSDTAGKIGAIIDVKTFMEQKLEASYDYVLDMDVTSPLRNVKDLQNTLEILIKDKEALNIFSVSPANRNPYFNMVEKNAQGYFDLSKEGKFLSRQTAPMVYEMNASFYFYSRKFFNQNQKSAITKKSLIYLVPHMCFDLDHPIDFEFMEFLLTTNKLDFKL